jgi:DNA transformation protein
MGSSVEAKAIAHDLVSQLEDADGIEVTSLFGGAALRAHGVVFASVMDEVVYLVVDHAMREELVALGSSPFSYARGERRIAMSKWYEAPASIFEDPEILESWIARAREAALVAAAMAPPEKPRRSKPKSIPPV